MTLHKLKAPILGACILIFLNFFVSCKKDQKKSPTKNAHDYLLGSWERTNDEEGRNTFEVWSKIGTVYTGLGYTMSAGDTIWQESLRLFKQDTTWTLEISGVNETATPFVLTSYTANSFVAENPNNEFPKTITYRYFDDTITAVISDDETEIPFIFWRSED
jgi:hypothetical protein